MKIVHLCLGAFFPDNYSYQENMLPKFHKEMGHDVEVIASLESFDSNGNICFTNNIGSYNNEYGIKVTRLPYSFPKKVNHKMKHYSDVYSSVEKSNPDILFIHNCQFLSIYDVIRYLKKHKEVKVYVDNHVDFSNSAQNIFSKYILHKMIWRHGAQKLNTYVKKFYGVLPARVDFLVNVYGLPREKVELLVMGADDDKVSEALSNGFRGQIRTKYGISQEDFVIMFGGKIDQWKTQILLLMEAVKRIQNPKVKLVVFGSVTKELKVKVQNLCLENRIQYIGWVPSDQSYQYWSACDLAVFPGRHSVFWEQVAGMGIPMVCKYWEGTTHVDCGGNVQFLYEDSVNEIVRVLEEIVNNPKKYKQMLSAAQGEARRQFSYKEIARRSIEL